MEAELIRFKAKSIDERALLFPPGSWVFGNFNRSTNNRYYISHPLAMTIWNRFAILLQMLTQRPSVCLPDSATSMLN